MRRTKTEIEAERGEKEVEKRQKKHTEMHECVSLCDDVISRQAVLEIQSKYAEDIGATKFWQMHDDIKALPPVTPQKKIGHWKGFIHSAYHGTDEYGEPIWREVTIYHCSQCNRRTVIKEKFCPNCGAKMESED